MPSRTSLPRLTVPAPGAVRQLRAGGQPLDAAVAGAAADWFTLLRSGEATAADQARWRQWHDAHADHARAWQHLQTVTGALPGLNAGGAAYRSLSPLHGSRPVAARRRLLGVIAGVGTAAGAGWLATRTPQWQQLAADYATGTGERRRHTLPDGTELLLGTRSAVALHWSGAERRVRLLHGEALFTTGHPAGEWGARPFVVETAEGRVRALGTRFSVRQDDAWTRVAVFEGAVEIRPASAAPGAAPLRLDAGQAAAFERTRALAPTVAGEREAAWSRGQLWVGNQRLDDFLAELGRYRPGWLRAAPEVAGLRFSGVFPLDGADAPGEPADTDAVLAMLPNSLPVQVRWRTRWWVVVEAAAAEPRGP
ncbi:FecR domain-containing protein [Paracidovorax wautersii]|uniref:Transmembrane sensor n=1 Tax=Paracidovorax wautersii TaxID=1177982 RepID=A0ABU1I915_9BURK|nr:FecR domain-containing protein [Paracidovorax wautersii]MDR6213008.1 transmembrane sensor [Paracidovorax wautersii]